ncbi:MAG: CDP-alcohol phosphatidyltransferase family protein, partial [Thermoleophilia bacterium]
MASLKVRYTDGARRLFFKAGVVLARRGVTADLLTLFGLAVHLVAIPLILGGHFVWAALVFLIAAVCDALDGAVARAGVGPTQAGAFLDSTTDRISEMIVFGALTVYMAQQERWLMTALVLVAMGAGQMVSYTRARAEALGVECKVGLMSRPERIVLLLAGFLFAGWHVGDVSLLTVAVWALAVLTSLTVVHRVLHTLRRLRAAGAGPA